jgi:hypothetical protein
MADELSTLGLVFMITSVFMSFFILFWAKWRGFTDLAASDRQRMYDTL